MDYKGRRVMVVGMAASGISAAKLLLEIGADVVLYDGKPIESFNLGELAEKCECIFGCDPTDRIPEMDVLVLSPGVPTRLGFIRKAYELGKEVIAEIELGYQLSPADFLEHLPRHYAQGRLFPVQGFARKEGAVFAAARHGYK